jgi:hypothetical protein
VGAVEAGHSRCGQGESFCDGLGKQPKAVDAAQMPRLVQWVLGWDDGVKICKSTYGNPSVSRRCRPSVHGTADVAEEGITHWWFT